MITNSWQLFTHFANGDVTYMDQTLQQLCGWTVTIVCILCTPRNSQDDKFDGLWNLYDLKLQHKAGSKMIVADALSRCADWSKGIDQDKVDVVALPDTLWIKLVNMELQDAVADTQKNNELAQDALCGLADPSVFPSRWTIVLSGSDSSTHLLFYNGCLYIPDNLGLRRQIVCDHHDTLMAGHLGALVTS